MLRTTVGLFVGGSVGLLVGFGTGYLVADMIGGSMFAIGGTFFGAFAGWIATLMSPGRLGDPDQAADYGDHRRSD